jgi:DNA polymerase
VSTLAIDIETYSSTDLRKSGVYKYVEALDFCILLFAYSLNNAPVEIVDIASGETLPQSIVTALTDPQTTKTAHNANFERTCIAKHFRIALPAEQWECTMAKASMLGLPLDLESVATVLRLQQKKDAAGKALIKYFSCPCKPTKVNGGRSRNLPDHDTDKWQAFKKYCVQDVVVEQSIREKIKWFSIMASEKRLWALDQKVNDTGVLLDHSFVKRVIHMDLGFADKLYDEALKLTGLENPNSVAQLKKWIGEETGSTVKSLSKETVPKLLKISNSEVLTRVLEIRQQMSRSSIKKYRAMDKAVCADQRVRGLLQFYGANRTGRWAGRLVQVQNLPKNDKDKFPDMDLIREVARSGDIDLLTILFDNVPDILSQLIRTSFVAPAGHRLLVSDFAAIEARVIAWLSGERWRLDLFNKGGKIYEASASQMFKIPIEKITKTSVYRQRGKVAELALGYQGGPGAIQKMEISNKVPMEERIPVEELPILVKMWRNANKKIVQYWYDVNDAALSAVEDGMAVTMPHGLKFFTEKGLLFIELPSGRRLSYLRPLIGQNKKGMISLSYEGVDQNTKKWGRIETYGGKLVENIVQGIARDLLADAMLRVDEADYKIVMHVHDEIVSEMPNGQGSVEELNSIMGKPIPWAAGLPLKAESFETEYYKKD